jgi:hypothetical protein
VLFCVYNLIAFYLDLVYGVGSVNLRNEVFNRFT